MRKAIDLENTSRLVPFIKLRVMGEDMLFLIDTGCEISCIEGSIVDHLPTKRIGMAVGAGGNHHLSSVDCQFNILHKQLKELARPGDNLQRLSQSAGQKVSGILGMDLLSQFKSFTINNKTRQFIFEL